MGFRGVCALVVGAALPVLSVGVALPAHAVEACTTRTVSQPFTRWADSNYYFPVTSGTFESGTSGWTVSSGVGVVRENEPWTVTGSGAYSLKIPAGGSASTPTMCIASDEDSVRFFYKSPGVSLSSLYVTMKTTQPLNPNVASTTTFNLDGSKAGWVLSPRIILPSSRDANGQQNLQITLSSRGSAADWQIDDVFVDPSRVR
jgi:hypothetical protein